MTGLDLARPSFALPDFATPIFGLPDLVMPASHPTQKPASCGLVVFFLLLFRTWNKSFFVSHHRSVLRFGLVQANRDRTIWPENGPSRLGHRSPGNFQSGNPDCPAQLNLARDNDQSPDPVRQHFCHSEPHQHSGRSTRAHPSISCHAYDIRIIDDNRSGTVDSNP